MHIEFVANANSQLPAPVGLFINPALISAPRGQTAAFIHLVKRNDSTPCLPVESAHAWLQRCKTRLLRNVLTSAWSQHGEALHNISSTRDPDLALLWVGSQPLWQLRSRHHEKSASLCRKHLGWVFLFFFYLTGLG